MSPRKGRKSLKDSKGSASIDKKKKLSPAVAKSIKRTPIQWVQRHSFSLPMELWQSLHEGDKLVKGRYVEPFVKELNSLPDVPCVLRSNGYSVSKQKFVIRFDCSHPECARQYQVRQIEENNFVLYDNGTEFVHVTKRTRQVRGTARAQLQQTMLTQLPTSYKKKTEGAMNMELFNQGNLQDVKSTSTLKVIRHEGIEVFDYDKDDVFDLFKMKITADRMMSEQYVQRVTGVPFAVTLISKHQFDCLRRAAQSGLEITIYFDATGGVVRHGELRIYYYAGVIAIHILNENAAKVVPIIQFINGKHDSFNIKIPLDEFKTEYHKQFPNDPWPIKYAVTDFSFASLNALCYAWNRLQLIEYINLVYHGLVSQADTSQISTFLQLCIGHLSKTFAKDVDSFYPELSSTKQAVLQEVFAGMCNCSNLIELRKIWTKLSTVLLSRSITDVVSDALKDLAVTMTTPFERDESVEIPESDRVPEIEKMKENDEPIYKQSKFFQYFKAATFKEEYKALQGAQNAYYSVEFAEMLLKKYFSIACLWTCLTQKTRKANTYVEGHFKDTKEDIISNSLTVEKPPLKCGRFIRLLHDNLKSQANSVMNEIPSERLCGYKPRARGKPRTPKDPSLLSLYSSTKSEIAVLSKQKLDNTSQMVTPSQHDDSPGIDNPHVEESWARKSRSKHSFFNQKSLKQISTGSTQVSSLLQQVPSKKSRKRNRRATMHNLLVPNPQTYMSAEINIVVASIGTVLLHRNSYKLLQSHNNVDDSLIKYIFESHRGEHRHVQFEAFKGQRIVSNQNDNRSIFNLTKNFLIATVPIDGQFALIIIDSNKKEFSYVNPSSHNPPEAETNYENFLQFVLQHNKKFKNKIPDVGWSSKKFDHHLQNDANDSGIFVLNFVDQYLTSSVMSAEFDPEEYRLELQHRVLRTATFMKNKCVICGYKEPPEYKLKNVDWVGCCSRDCDRWTHVHCAQVNAKIDEVFDKYYCFICKASSIDANFPKSDCKDDPKVDDIKTSADGNENNIDGNTTSFEGNETSVEGNKTSVEDSESSVDGNETSVEGNKTSVEDSESSVDGKETSVEGKETSVEDNESSVDGKETSVESNETCVESNDSDNSNSTQ